MGAHPKGNRTEKEKAADKARKAWWTEERRKKKAEERAKRNKEDWFRQKVSNGWRHNKRSNKLR